MQRRRNARQAKEKDQSKRSIIGLPRSERYAGYHGCANNETSMAVKPPMTDDAPPFDKEEVRRAINSMKNGKAPGPDRIEVEILKASHAIICKELQDLFNACLRYDTFSETWKENSIHALLKDPDGDASDPVSYRPICLLSVIGKCLEKLLAERLRPLFSDSCTRARINTDFEGEDGR